MRYDWNRLLLCAALLVGCGDDLASGAAEGGTDETDSDEGGSTEGSDDGETEPPAEELEYLDPIEHLVRVSMALRGVRPGPDELDRVADDPEAIAEIVEEYLVDPRFGETIRELHDDALLVAQEVRFPQLAPFDDEGGFTLGASIMQGPLRLAEHVVMDDRPYTELVTADYAVVDELAAAIGGMSFDPGGPTLQQIEWGDRPAAGVLSDSAIFLRYRSTGSNFHRGRANAISKALLCHDFLAADVEIDGSIDLSDPDEVNDAVTQNPACVSCHQTLDPLASFFWGYPGNLNPNQIEAYPVVGIYNANAEDNWQNATGRPPAFFGQAADDLHDLGQLIADDPRFSLCAAKRFYSFFHQVELDAVPLEDAARLQATLVDSGFDAKSLVREIVLGDDFRAAAGLTEAAAEDLVGLKMARPSQLARLMDDLTGFRWETSVDDLVAGFNEGDIDLMHTNFLGFAVLGGGTDSFFVERPANTVNTTTSLLLRAYAAEVASYTAEHDLLGPSEQARLLTLVDANSTDEADIREQLTWLHLRIFAEDLPTDAEEIDASWALWSAAHEHGGDPVRAWKTTLTAMLQDLRIIYY